MPISESLIMIFVEAAIAVAVKAYVDARDIEARRTQAESIAFLTHELRNPLTTAVLTTAKLRRQARPEEVKPVETLQRSLGRLGELIDGVLLTQKLEAGQMVVAPADIELAACSKRAGSRTQGCGNEESGVSRELRRQLCRAAPNPCSPGRRSPISPTTP